VERGRLRPGDELSIAHIRYRLENGQGHEKTIAEPAGLIVGRPELDEDRDEPAAAVSARPPAAAAPLAANVGENAFAEAVRKLLPSGVADKCRIQVIVQMAGENEPIGEQAPAPSAEKHASENAAECHSEWSH
jgi:hypothetical protein